MEVQGTHGTVSIKLIGVAEVAQMLMKAKNDILTQMDRDLLQATTITASEVQNSIMGLRSEPRSVDTGNFANSIQTSVSDNEGKVYTDIEYAKFLEYGTSKMEGRHHFGNTALQLEPGIKEIFNLGVKSVTDKL